MKSLKKHIILYDDECPLCDLYTGGFVKAGMLDQDGRVPFSGINEELMCLIDQKRACNEIALVDTEHKRVRYGADSLVEIVNAEYLPVIL